MSQNTTAASVRIYRQNHRRVLKNRGKARDAGACTDCGGVAQQWSQVHGTSGADPSDYEPRCVTCHHKYDGHGPGPGPLTEIVAETADPPYLQLAEILRSQIESGELAPGRLVPSIVTLSQRYGLAKTTVRKSLALLRAEGLIESRPSWGTFVRRQ